MRKIFSANIFSFFLLFCSNTLFAQKTSKPIDLYSEAWKESNSKTRLNIIRSFWSDKSIYEDPTSHVSGSEAFYALIEKFWKDFPGASIEMGAVHSVGNFHHWEWKIYNKGNLILTGADFAETNDKDQMVHLVGFWDYNNLATANTDVVKTYYESLFKKQDFNTIDKIVAPNAIYYQAVGLPYGGTYNGFAEWLNMYKKASTYFDLQIVDEPQYLIGESDESLVVILFTISCTSKKSGQKMSMPVSEKFQIENGKITSIRPFYFDTKSFSAFLK